VSRRRERGAAARSVCIGAENITSKGIRSPDHPAFSGSLYRLRYPGSHITGTKLPYHARDLQYVIPYIIMTTSPYTHTEVAT
jgi:hypothetical protein